MKSVRLSEDLRNKIVTNICQSSRSFQKLEKLKERRAAIFISIRDFTLGKDKDKYLSLPEKLQAFDSSIYISHVPEFDYARVGGTKTVCPVDRVIFDDLPKTLRSRLTLYLEQKRNLEREIKEIKVKAVQVVYGCSSTKQLLETMPEADKYIPENVLTTGTQIMVSQETVNELRKLAA